MGDGMGDRRALKAQNWKVYFKSGRSKKHHILAENDHILLFFLNLG